MSETRFVDVILPLAIARLYTYRVPRELEDDILVGARVVVQFGKNKRYSAIVRTIHHKAPEHYQAKYIESVLDDSPVVNDRQFALWEWMSNYYLCSLGEILHAALPAGLKLSSETKIIASQLPLTDYSDLSDDEFLIAQALEVNEVLDLSEVSEIISKKTVYPLVKSMIEKGVIEIAEEIREKYKEKKVAYVKLAEGAEQEDILKAHFDGLERAPKQLEAMMAYVQLSQMYSDSPNEVRKSVLQNHSGSNSSVILQLVKKGILEIYEKAESRLPEISSETDDLHPLSDAQQTALEEIKQSFEEKDVTLLHGVTSSGKTEIYTQLIQETLSAGKQVLYLLPEIALTTQIITRLRKHFGEGVGIYHSKFNQNERVEVWKQVMLASPKSGKVVLGARSALFLPFQDLGLIIVDEEHETTFKQFEPSPRYHARDSSVVLAKIHGAKVLLGSATPSIESFHNANSGKYDLVTLDKRFKDIQMPEILVTDIKEASRKKEMKSHFSPLLVQNIEHTLSQGEQVILFQNRRGHSPYIICDTCGWSPQCKQCDVGLTYHKYFHKLQCHYCGYSIPMPQTCSACGNTTLQLKGFGTEKIEEELAIFFPKARVARMDLDTTRSKDAYQHMIRDFEDRAIDILVGTQMVTKGLDFRHVALVGILNADSMLNFPDFRAFERSFQLMQQVSGRAGRSEKRGKVIIQSYNPEHPIIRDVVNNNYSSMFLSQIHERKDFHYPPFYRLVRIIVQHRDIHRVNDAAGYFSKLLREKFGSRVLGPEFPLIARIRNRYNKHILLKIEKEARLASAKKILKELIEAYQLNEKHRSVRLIIDVDPY